MAEKRELLFRPLRWKMNWMEQRENYANYTERRDGERPGFALRRTESWMQQEFIEHFACAVSVWLSPQFVQSSFVFAVISLGVSIHHPPHVHVRQVKMM